MEKQPQMTPEQIAADEAAIKAIRERNLAARAAEAAKEKIAESYDFSNSAALDSADKKAFSQEARAARLAQDQEAANRLSAEIKKAA